MPDIMVLLACVSQYIEPTPFRQLGRVIEAMLSMSGRVTMRGLSRWGGKGGSYRTIQRFLDRKSTRLNSSHVSISYAVFCLKKKIKQQLDWPWLNPPHPVVTAAVWHEQIRRLRERVSAAPAPPGQPSEHRTAGGVGRLRRSR